MKIGILTYHRAENYGALLQAYALRTYLQQLGHNVSFVDYWPEYHVEHYRIFSLKRFRKMTLLIKVKYILFLLVWGVPLHLRKSRLKRFMRKRLCLEKKIRYQGDDEMTEKYDVVVYGSDQIWRRQDIQNNEFNPWYFGSSNIVADKKIAYAASMGIIDTTEQENETIQGWLRTFNSLAVRENSLQAYLRQIGYNPQLVIDPTFLLSKQEWGQLFTPQNSGKYILFYNLLLSEESVRFANDLSKATGLAIREINMKLQFSHILSKRYIGCASLEQFLQLIDGAEYIVSNSFHGVAFSLIFEKQFWALGIGKKADRVLTLLDTVGIKERYIYGGFSKALLTKEINYCVIRPKLQEMISESTIFLAKSIK